MKTVILAAGNGTRMGELTKSTPKPLLKIQDKTLLEYKMDILPENCDEIIIVIGYLGDKIREYFGAEYKGKKITYIEAETLGTGYALWAAKEYLTEPFIVMCGDDLYTKKDIEECVKHPFASLVHRSEKEISGGSVLLDENEEYIKDIVEGSHKKGAVIATGLYVLTPEVFSLPLVQIPNRKEYGLPQTIMQMKERGIRSVFATAWYQVTAPEDLVVSSQEINTYLP